MAKATVTKGLEAMAKLYQKKNEEYGDTYKMHGTMMSSFFPNGIELSTEEDLARYAIFETMAGKMLRYSQNFFTGGHVDSLDDISVYAQMLQELDNDAT